MTSSLLSEMDKHADCWLCAFGSGGNGGININVRESDEEKGRTLEPSSSPAFYHPVPFLGSRSEEGRKGGLFPEGRIE